MKRLLPVIFSPVLCAGLLAGVYTEKKGRVRAEDADPYHHAAKAAIDGMPYQLGGWIGQDQEVPAAAVKLLKPNTILSRVYVDPSGGGKAGLLVVQCRDSRDMLGHYPPVCYPAHGMTQNVAEARDWKLDGPMTVTGTEYEFATTGQLQPHRMVVYNFMVVPGEGIVRDMAGVGEAAADYQKRYFGAAQVQVTFSADLTRERRDEIFKKLIGPNVPMLKTLLSGGITR